MPTTPQAGFTLSNYEMGDRAVIILRAYPFKTPSLCQDWSQLVGFGGARGVLPTRLPLAFARLPFPRGGNSMFAQLWQRLIDPQPASSTDITQFLTLLANAGLLDSVMPWLNPLPRRFPTALPPSFCANTSAASPSCAGRAAYMMAQRPLQVLWRGGLYPIAKNRRPVDGIYISSNHRKEQLHLAAWSRWGVKDLSPCKSGWRGFTE